MHDDRWIQGVNGWYYLKSSCVMAENEWVSWAGGWYYLARAGRPMRTVGDGLDRQNTNSLPHAKWSAPG